MVRNAIGVEIHLPSDSSGLCSGDLGNIRRRDSTSAFGKICSGTKRELNVGPIRKPPKHGQAAAVARRIVALRQIEAVVLAQTDQSVDVLAERNTGIETI